MIKLQRVKNGQTEPCRFAPDVEPVAVDEVAVVRMRPIETRRAERCVELTFVDGETWNVVGTLDEILKKFDGID